MKAETSNLHTYASCPGELTLSNQKLKQLRPDLYGILGLICKAKDKYCLGFTKIEKIKAHIYYGDSQPAVVISLKPLIVAAYSEDLDCILPLKFPNKFVKNYKLKEKSRLLTINIYSEIKDLAKDIILGKNHSGLWGNFSPIIAEFVSNDKNLIEKNKKIFNEDLWEYVYKLGLEYLELYPNTYRDGRPLIAFIPIKEIY
ncbi:MULTISPECIES: hypothetical protein [Clostridium]|uniref:Uncharacterized protein n=1 Tax=Clostridium cadaveris TaxID=1529 RepID=A0A1I2Q6W1_9CLOT|nr:hypothetical protein [Clostridium cadaveris]MDU4953555.1 hypothetical protein [Clostridium sp.]MDM8312259.1 hypothetical protein [Clostridium cadaveris]MDY4948618.1 hypothetical protein [Clostridium cadaveris]NME66128.1 hypothetical protein [Clostridium cadaveris]NWK12725.1 hypothetical protein [Clostridium cadaveris]